MKKSLLFFCFVVLMFNSSIAQYYTNQNKVWAFGGGAGLDFNSGSPVYIHTGMNTDEGCASVCDASGHLLFYSNGKIVYDKTGTIMPHGASIVSFLTKSTEQAALIIPVIGNANQYYLFSLQGCCSGSGSTHMAYSIVDISLNGGLGDVISSSMGTPLADTLGENMIAIAGDNNDIWLVTHRNDTTLFLAFNISSTGLNTLPVVSPVGNFHGYTCYGISMLRESPNRRKIAQGILANGSCYGTFIYDFDPATGIISNCIVVDTTPNGTYGVEFSPNGTKLYANSSGAANEVIQYDISLATEAEIQASKFIITDSTTGADLRLAPDGKIYFEDGNSSVDINCISFPNLAGAACGFIEHDVIVPLNTSWETFPNLYVSTDTVNRTGVNDIENGHQVVIYPNPAQNELTISSTTIITHITITNLLGQTIYTKEYNEPQVRIDVGNLPSGIYLIRINDTEVRKFVKE